jgi:transaldolase
MEVVADTADEMYYMGMNLAEAFPTVSTIKLPCSVEGVKACTLLSTHRIRTNVTLIFSPAQAILASLAGATYISPFIGRMDDNSLSGLGLIADISKVYKKQFINTLILAASVRDVQSVGKAFELGADICTIPPKVFDNMANHVLTDKGLEQFNRDFLA